MEIPLDSFLGTGIGFVTAKPTREGCMLRRLVSLVVVPLVLLVACSSSPSEPRSASNRKSSATEQDAGQEPDVSSGGADSGEERAGTEVQNEQNETAERLDAFQQAQ